MHVPHLTLIIAAWIIALAWFSRAVAAARGLRTVADLSRLSAPGPTHVTLTVIVPARNEQNDIAACLESLLAQDIPTLQIIAVDDRSTDRTGELMDEIAARTKGRLRVLHLTTLPPGWLGKTHAMHAAAAFVQSDYLLFTDADVIFRHDALSRALAYAEAERTDHLVLAPTTVIRRWDEAGVLGLFQLMGLWAARPWRVADPGTRDAIGIGAFNMIRRDAYERIGGYASPAHGNRRGPRAGPPCKETWPRTAHRLWPRIGEAPLGQWRSRPRRRNDQEYVCRLSLQSFAASARVRVARRLLRTAISRLSSFHSRSGRRCSLVSSMAVCYRVLSPITGISAWNVLLAPFAASLFIFTLLRSMLTTLRQRGVIWRGTFYPLTELRRALPPVSELFRPRRTR